MKITIKAARVNANLTQRRAAEKLGISRYTLMGYEKVPERVPYALADGMSRVYGVSKDNLIFLREETA